MARRVLVTGANGFVGAALVKALTEAGTDVVPVVRARGGTADPRSVAVGDIHGATAYGAALDDVDVVVHLAARVHVMNDAVEDPLHAYREVNVDGTLNLARQAIAAGVRRFVFVSSIKVNGESTTGRGPFTAQEAVAPEDPYGQSKWEAEQALRALVAGSGMEIVILRPPLVYGPGVKANFRSLIALARRRLPLPFGCVNNRRSLVYLGNLVDLLIRCLDHPAAANRVWLVSDGDDLSLRALVTALRHAMGRGPGMVPVPEFLFRLAGKLSGRAAVVERLVGDLRLDIGSTRSELDWQPPFPVARAIALTVADFNSRNA